MFKHLFDKIITLYKPMFGFISGIHELALQCMNLLCCQLNLSSMILLRACKENNELVSSCYQFSLINVVTRNWKILTETAYSLYNPHPLHLTTDCRFNDCFGSKCECWKWTGDTPGLCHQSQELQSCIILIGTGRSPLILS